MSKETRINNHGGKRENAGRKPTGRSKHQYYITNEENIKLREYLIKLRSVENENR